MRWESYIGSIVLVALIAWLLSTDLRNAFLGALRHKRGFLPLDISPALRRNEPLAPYRPMMPRRRTFQAPGDRVRTRG